MAVFDLCKSAAEVSRKTLTNNETDQKSFPHDVTIRLPDQGELVGVEQSRCNWAIPGLYVSAQFNYIRKFIQITDTWRIGSFVKVQFIFLIFSDEEVDV